MRSVLPSTFNPPVRLYSKTGGRPEGTPNTVLDCYVSKGFGAKTRLAGDVFEAKVLH
jgi:hypothetical protein